MFDNQQNSKNQKIKKGQRGRPKKVLTEEQILALQNKIKKGRGRPRKILSAEELKAIKERWQRSGGKRGRPKKILTPEQEMLKLLKRQQGKGRPKKKLTPQEEWALKIKFNIARGRPLKNYVVWQSLPVVNQNIDKKLDILNQNNCFPKDKLKPDKKIEQSESIEKEIRRPVLSWHDFKQKFQLSDFGEDFIFSAKENKHSDNNSKIARVIKVKSAENHSLYVLDLRKQKADEQIENNNTPDQMLASNSTKYAWEEKHSEENIAGPFLNFDVPADLGESSFKVEMTKIPKIKTKEKKLKLNLIGQQGKEFIKKTEEGALSEKIKWLDKFLINLGKSVYLIWQILISPFKFLDFVVDRTLKAIWIGVKYVFNFIYKVLALNYSYLKKLSFFLLPQTEIAQNEHLKINIKKPMIGFVLALLLIISPVIFLNTLDKIEQIKGAVLGVSWQGVENLKQASENLKNKNFDLALSNFNLAEENFKQAKFEIKDLGKTANLILGLVPNYKNSAKILRAGELSSSLGRELSQALQIFENNQTKTSSQTFCRSLPGREQECTSFSDLNLSYKVSYLKNSLSAQKFNIEELIEIIENLDLDSLAQEHQEKVKAIKENIQNFKNGFNEFEKILNFLSESLGTNEPKRYLVIFQNSNEMRATGGFMGSFAVVDVFGGNVEKMEIPGGGLYDLKAANQMTVEAPKPLQIFSPLWQIWNANWFPDYKVSAEKIKWFYENMTSGSTVDGIICLTQDVVESLLNQTGPIEMASYDKVLTADNFTQEIQTAVELEFDKIENKPKKIISDLAPILLERLMNLNSADSFETVMILEQALKEKKILFYFKDDEMQKMAQDFNWSGEMKNLSSNQDYLMVVHTNISGGKTDGVIDNKVEHRVEIQPDGSLLAAVTLTRRHNGNPSDVFESASNVDYVRFYVPLGSKFISATGFNFSPNYLFKSAGQDYKLSPDKTLEQIEKNVYLDEASNTRLSEEFGRTVFGNWLQVSPDKEQTVEIKYELPFNYKTANQNNFNKWLAKIFGKKEQIKYSLVVEKQPGMNEVDFSSQLVMPADYQVIDSTASSDLDINGDKIEFKSDLLRDGYWGVVIED